MFSKRTLQEEYKALEVCAGIEEIRDEPPFNTASDGWVPTDAGNETIEDHKKLYDEFSAKHGRRKTRENSFTRSLSLKSLVFSLSFSRTNPSKSQQVATGAGILVKNYLEDPPL